MSWTFFRWLKILEEFKPLAPRKVNNNGTHPKWLNCAPLHPLLVVWNQGKASISCKHPTTLRKKNRKSTQAAKKHFTSIKEKGPLGKNSPFTRKEESSLWGSGGLRANKPGDLSWLVFARCINQLASDNYESRNEQCEAFQRWQDHGTRWEERKVRPWLQGKL